MSYDFDDDFLDHLDAWVAIEWLVDTTRMFVALAAAAQRGPTYKLGEQRQCDAVALTVTEPNCCQLPAGHKGPHINSQDFEFRAVCSSIADQHDEIVKHHYCVAHPKYKARRKPSRSCEDCWRLYILLHPSPLLFRWRLLP